MRRPIIEQDSWVTVRHPKRHLNEIGRVTSVVRSPAVIGMIYRVFIEGGISGTNGSIEISDLYVKPLWLQPNDRLTLNGKKYIVTEIKMNTMGALMVKILEGRGEYFSLEISQLAKNALLC